VQIGGEGIENLLIIMLQCWKKKLKKDTNPKRHISMPLYSGMG
jgi:hypothetical protein